MSFTPYIGITGGLGLIGKSLRSHLTQFPLVFMSRQAPVDNLLLNEKCLVGSFTDSLIAEQFTKNLDVLIHAATAVGPRSEFENQFIENDLVGTINLAKIFFKNNPKGHFVFLSTAGGLYDLENKEIKTELSPVDTKSIYGAIKLLIEDSLEKLSGAEGRVTILRPAPVYGDSHKKNKTIGLIDKLLNSISGESVQIFDKLESARDYLHVSDLSNAIKTLLLADLNYRYEIFNIGTGSETSIFEVINIIKKISDEDIHYEILEVDKKASSLIVSSDKLFKLIGWKAEIRLEDGVLEMSRELKELG